MTRKEEFESMGGRALLEKITKVFYDKVYAHPWIGQYFKEIKQEIIEEQQVDFLQGALGGEKVYCGKLPVPAHKHMFITDELFDLRTDLLVESIKECNGSEELTEKILKIDHAFKSGIVKKSLGDCEKRYNTDVIMDIPNPEKKAA
jgi:truncated hemoglobin YjbI